MGDRIKRGNNRHRRASRTLCVLALSAIVVASCGRIVTEAPPKPHVSVAYPIVKRIIDWDDFVGRFQAVQDVTVMPRVSGAITMVLFKNGQDVKAGQPLFIIDPRPFRAVWLQAIANLDTAKATLANATANLKRGK